MTTATSPTTNLPARPTSGGRGGSPTSAIPTMCASRLMTMRRKQDLRFRILRVFNPLLAPRSAGLCADHAPDDAGKSGGVPQGACSGARFAGKKPPAATLNYCTKDKYMNRCRYWLLAIGAALTNIQAPAQTLSDVLDADGDWLDVISAEQIRIFSAWQSGHFGVPRNGKLVVAA